MRIAFLGLGIMGRPMAANLVKAGNEVTVWNRTPGKDVEGAHTAATPADAAQGAEVVWMCVSDTAAVEKTIFGDGGAESVLAQGMVIVDSSTISPNATRRFSERVNAKGAEWVDAPVTGSKIGAEAGQLVFMVGGREETLARLQPLFSAMGKANLRMGDTGAGQSAKIAMNLMIAMTYEGFAEALTLSRKLGVNSEDFIGLVNQTMVRSGVTDYKAPFVLKHDFSPNFPLRLMHNDIHLMLDASKEARVKLPGIAKVDEIYEVASEEGLDDLDYAATLGLLEKWAGLSE